MILLDTNVLIYAFDDDSPHNRWSRQTIADAVGDGGASINAVSLAEICVGDEEPETVADRIRSWGVEILDVPAAAAELCAKAYRRYRHRRRSESGKDALRMPLPDFFIGAHAQTMAWHLASVDPGRFRTYFPSVRLETP
jgi:predicted nucleic acid-binding protein